MLALPRNAAVDLRNRSEKEGSFSLVHIFCAGHDLGRMAYRRQQRGVAVSTILDFLAAGLDDEMQYLLQAERR